MKKHIILLSALLLTGTVKAQSPLPGKTEILEAIEGCTTYATNVLLDESGKSRCDYNMVQENGILMKSHGIRDKLFWVCWMLMKLPNHLKHLQRHVKPVIGGLDWKSRIIRH